MSSRAALASFNGARLAPEPKRFDPRSPDVPPPIEFRWEWVTPEIASEYLSLNFENNRERKGKWIRDLAAMMREGGFFPTHQGIAFDPDAFLVDGQNRLLAIVESGVPCWLAVATNVERNWLVAIDLGYKRSLADHARIAYGDKSITRDAGAVCRALLEGFHPSANDFPYQELIRLIGVHRPAIEFAEACKTKGVTAIVRGIIGKAWYHVDREKLARFYSILRTGVSENALDAVPVRLRNVAQSQTWNGTDQRGILARKTGCAIRAYIEGRAISKIVEIDSDPWPVPELD